MHLVIFWHLVFGNILIENGTMRDIFVGDKVIFQVAGNMLYSIIVLK